MTFWMLVTTHVQAFLGVALLLYFSVVMRNAVALFAIPLFNKTVRKYRKQIQLAAASQIRKQSMPGRTLPIRDFGIYLQNSVPIAVIAAAIIMSQPGYTAAGENWPSFQNGGQVSLESDHAAKLSERKWTATIKGYGQSSPVAFNGQVYVTSVSGENKDQYHITAYRIADGEQIWQHDLANATPQENNNYVSKAAPTPAADDNGVICSFEGGNLVALTHEGVVRWERNLVEEYGAIDARHGLAASLEQSDDAVFVWVERQTDPYVLAVDKPTGKTIWKVPGIGATSWASPRLIEVDGGSHLVLSGIGTLKGLDPETGEQLWSFDGISGNSTPTPIPMGEGRFLIGATVGRESSGDGNAAESNGVVAIQQVEPGVWNVDYLWKAKRATSSFGSPIIHSGFAYFVNRSGVLYCLDATSGQEAYAERVGSSVWATPIAFQSRLLFFGKDGVVKSIAAGNTFHVLGEANVLPDPAADSGAGEANPFGGPTLYAGIAVDNTILVRSGNELICLGP